jgi:hypothetical protein
MIRHAVQLLGPAVTAAGIALSIYGTFLLTRWYHPFSVTGFLSTLWNLVVLLLRGEAARVFEEAKTASRIGLVNEEQRAESLVGIYFIFLGFVLQLVGTGFWALDEIMGFFRPG